LKDENSVEWKEVAKEACGPVDEQEFGKKQRANVSSNNVTTDSRFVGMEIAEAQAWSERRKRRLRQVEHSGRCI
jgi:hypothetical protein